MTDKTPEAEKPDEAAFQRTLETMLRTPPKPHATKKGREPKPAPKKAASVSDTPEYQALRRAVLAAQAARFEPSTPEAST